MGEMKNAYKILVEKPKALGKHRNRWWRSVTMNLKETG
jgi:hypothetical protein